MTKLFLALLAAVSFSPLANAAILPNPSLKGFSPSSTPYVFKSLDFPVYVYNRTSQTVAVVVGNKIQMIKPGNKFTIVSKKPFLLSYLSSQGLRTFTVYPRFNVGYVFQSSKAYPGYSFKEIITPFCLNHNCKID